MSGKPRKVPRHDSEIDATVEALVRQSARVEGEGGVTSASGIAEDDLSDWSEGEDEAGLNALLELSKTAKADPRPQQPTEIVAQASSLQGSSPLKGVVNEASASKDNISSELVIPAPSSSSALVIVDEEAQATLSARNKKVLGAKAKQEASIKQLRPVDHSKMNYPPFKKDFYIAPTPERELSAVELKALFKELDGAKLKGRDLPLPMKTWEGIGLSDAAFEYLRESGYAQPFAVQSLAIPALMSGRDLLITAKTGSGKTLAYMLPLVRHVENQRRAANQEGPIGLIVVPTIELAQQIYQVAVPLCRACRLRIAPAYGGTNLSENIPAVKRGCDVMVATPNRLYDLLLMNGETVMNLRRVTFFVVDEADRMLDDGFRPYVNLFLKNIRPDRQVAMISATMPPLLRELASKFLEGPIFLTVGGRPSPSSNVSQTIEFFDEMVHSTERVTTIVDDPRFRRLLEILGDEVAPPCSRCVLIFVQRKEDCDTLYTGLRQMGYFGYLGVLYGGMESADRAMALKNFTPEVKPILIAAGLAERGLDVYNLDLVINYTMPDHYEAYIQRIGRTGRAGKRGRAISFFTRKADDALANDLALGLEESGNEVPEDLHQLAQVFRAAHKNAGSIGMKRGYLRAKTFDHDSKEERARRRQAARDMGIAGYMSDGSATSDSEIDSDAEVAEKRSDPPIVRVNNDSESRAVALYGSSSSGALTLTSNMENRVQDALAFAQQLTAADSAGTAAVTEHVTEIEINDMMKKLRLRLSSRTFLRELEGETGTRILVKGRFFDPSARFKIPEGERKMYLEIRGSSRENVVRVLRKIEECRKDIESKAARRGSAFGIPLE